MTPENYENELPKNTRDLVKKCYDTGLIEKTSGLEVTFLMNCLSGLIAIVSEKHRDRIYGKNISDLSTNLPEKFFGTNPKGSCCREILSSEYSEISAVYFISKLRNGISHFYIQAQPAHERWEYVIIQDYNVGQDTDKIFEIRLSIAQLRDLAIAISELV